MDRSTTPLPTIGESGVLRAHEAVMGAAAQIARKAQPTPTRALNRIVFISNLEISLLYLLRGCLGKHFWNKLRVGA